MIIIVDVITRSADTWCVVVRRALLSFAASFLDMTNVTFPEEKQGPAHRKAFRALMDAREDILSKLCVDPGRPAVYPLGWQCLSGSTHSGDP